MNKKYYDGAALVEVLSKHIESAEKYIEILKAFADVKGVDAVQVVRCKDCRYFYPAEYDKKGNTCLLLREMINAPIWVKEDDYCSRGERKEHGKIQY